MMETGKNLLIRFQRRWQLQQIVEILLYAFGFTILVYFSSKKWLPALLTFLITAGVGLIFRKPWNLTLKRITSTIDNKLAGVEYSTGLLLKPEERLSDIALLQREHVLKKLASSIGKVIPRHHFKWSMVTLAICLTVGFLIVHFNLVDRLLPNSDEGVENEMINFQPADSLDQESELPIIIGQVLTIEYPAYTRKRALNTSQMDITALEGSRLSWRIEFDTPVEKVVLESNSKTYDMQFKEGAYINAMVLRESGFYNFRFMDTHGGTHISDLYSLEATSDRRPTIEIEDLKQFSTFEFTDEKLLNFNTVIKDDYGIQNAQIVATVSKGSGESVKFREEKLRFDKKIISGSKQLLLSKAIDLNNMNMEPGDELYFYVEAFDNRRPEANEARSETFFAIIKDTLTDQFAVAGTMGADLMPDYFRSQRQLIIDTEKLISDKSRLPKQEFNSISNELGFDQKALRLKYGEFMGDEADSGIQVAQQNSDEVQENDDPLEEFTHDHDGDNEHNLVDDGNQEEKEEEEAEDTLHDYLHNHDDPEESTLFTQSLRSKLKQAMAEMWDAELHLRLFTPTKSLPYQYRALKLIQEIKNSARIYVHRIGFDPPPIKEEVRLTGELKEIHNFQKKEKIGKPLMYPTMRQSVERLEALILAGILITEKDKNLFEAAGNELAALAIKEPLKYLKTLQQLKWLTEDSEKTTQMLREVQQGLLMALPAQEPNPNQATRFNDEINELFLKELELYER